jgi:hypothetical protein
MRALGSAKGIAVSGRVRESPVKRRVINFMVEVRNLKLKDPEAKI